MALREREYALDLPHLIEIQGYLNLLVEQGFASKHPGSARCSFYHISQESEEFLQGPNHVALSMDFKDGLMYVSGEENGLLDLITELQGVIGINFRTNRLPGLAKRQ